MKYSTLVLCILISFSWGGVDVKVNQDSGFLPQNETSITLNPAIIGNLIVAYNEDPGGPGGIGNGIGISYSPDFGFTWADTQVSEVWGIEGDPSVDADLNGRVYAGFMSYKGFFTDTNGIYVAVSIDSGKSWSPPIPVDLFQNSPSNPGPFTDKPYLTVDNHPGSPFANYIYITWQRDNVNGVNSDVYFSASYNGGLSYTPPQKISDLPSNVSQCVGQVPKVAPNGDVYVVWGDFPLSGHTTGHLFFDKSSDSGATWGSDVLIDSFLVIPKYPNQTSNSFYVRSYPTIGVNPQNSNDVYVAVAADPDGIGGPDDGDIFMWASYDGGNTWNPPVRVNDDATINDQFQPWMDVKPDGTIDIIWLDRRNDPNDEDFEIWFANSNDGGQSFSQNIPVSDLMFPLLPDPYGWMGEYIGIDVDSFAAYIAWTDTRLNDRDIYFDYIDNIIKINETNLDVNRIHTLQSFPNPFAKETRIMFFVTSAGYITLSVYNVSGRLVNKLLAQRLEQGVYERKWKGTIKSGAQATPGIYFIEFKQKGIKEVKSVIYLK